MVDRSEGCSVFAIVTDRMFDRVSMTEAIPVGEDTFGGGRKIAFKFSSNFNQLIECDGLGGEI